jgi:hypothetical protein
MVKISGKRPELEYRKRRPGKEKLRRTCRQGREEVHRISSKKTIVQAIWSITHTFIPQMLNSFHVLEI